MKIEWNMRWKIFFMTLIINILIIAIMSIIFYQKTTDFFTEEYAKSLADRLYICTKNIDNFFQDTYRYNIEISFDKQICTILEKKDLKNEDLIKIAEILQRYKERNKQIDNIYCYLPTKNTLIKSEEFKSVEFIEDINKKNYWQKILKQQQGMKPLFINDMFDSSAKYIFLYITTIIDEKNDISAYIICTINERMLYYNYLDDVIRDNDSIIYMFDNTGKTTSTNRMTSEDITENLYKVIDDKKLGQYDLNINDNVYLGVYDVAPFSQYALYFGVNKNVLLEKLWLLQAIVIFLMVVIIFVAVVGTDLISAKLNEPIEELSNAMNGVAKGNFTVRASVRGKDEIAKLALVFNYMVSKINKLVDDLATEKSLKKEAELNALQYQIRPHFIYNTLNSIRFAAMMQGAKNIGTLLGSFIDLLQISTNRKGSFAILEEELNTLKNYILLQEFRLMDSFKVVFDIDENTVKYYVPRLILQPLVENSIIHAPSKEKQFCKIVVRSYIKKNILYLEVEDDGKGISEEQINNFKNMNKLTSGGFSSIGVFNIKERLNLYYGTKGKLLYFSDNKSYTKAQIQLPLSIKNDEYKL